jgi:sigma-B regulation protein RsbU (phosphoserine phosphatase)
MKSFLGISFLRFQVVIIAVGLAVSAMYWLILGSAKPFEALFFAIVTGNATFFALEKTAPFYARKPFPRDWFIYLAILLPVALISGSLAAVIWKLLNGNGIGPLLPGDWSDIRTGTFASLIAGVSIYISQKSRSRLEARNRELENQVTMGRRELQTQEAEITAAHEIQAHLLPREIPQVKGFQISCAWQPAHSVSGDYFDVLATAPGQIAVCLADVSGKGIAAALLMANLQAAVRAFAPSIPSPGALCRKLNEVLCGSVAPGKFVTLFYGVVDTETLTLRYENAGHVYPIVLRGESPILLTDGATVLGLFPDVQYEERSFTLQSGDCLLLTTDGVTEAADETDDEFGASRVTASARIARSQGAHGIRTRILEDVTKFCKGNFHDDASLIVVTVE